MATMPQTYSTREDAAVSATDETTDDVQIGSFAEVHDDQERELPESPPDPVMEAFGLNVFYGDFHAVHDVNLSFGKNEITALIGSLDPRDGMQAMTGYMATTAGGENPVGSPEYNTLFAVGMTLFLITLVINIISIRLVRRFRQEY